MEKQIRNFKVDFDLHWAYNVTIKEMREDLDALEKLGVTEIEIRPEEEWGNLSITIEAFVNRMETDEEYESRIKEEAQEQARIRYEELSELARLRSKYSV